MAREKRDLLDREGGFEVRKGRRGGGDSPLASQSAWYDREEDVPADVPLLPAAAALEHGSALASAGGRPSPLDLSSIQFVLSEILMSNTCPVPPAPRRQDHAGRDAHGHLLLGEKAGKSAFRFYDRGGEGARR